jgi:isoleucyl-tRNA synthetase
MKELTPIIQALTHEQIVELEKNGQFTLTVQGQEIQISKDDVEIFTEDIPGWVVQRQGDIVVALDTEITEVLYLEGLARDMVNRIQNLRKEKDFEVTDKIHVFIKPSDIIQKTLDKFSSYICRETLTEKLELKDDLEEDAVKLDIGDDIPFIVTIKKA